MMKKLIFSLLFVLGISTHVDAQKPYKAYMVSNTHLDTQWLWTVQTTIDHYLYRTLTQNFWLIDHYPGYIFNLEGAVRYQWAKEYYPTEYERLKNYIKAGRWNISGSSWDSTDPNIPSPESFSVIFFTDRNSLRKNLVKNQMIFFFRTVLVSDTPCPR